jgi:hypothetical protein
MTHCGSHQARAAPSAPATGPRPTGAAAIARFGFGETGLAGDVRRNIVRTAQSSDQSTPSVIFSSGTDAQAVRERPAADELLLAPIIVGTMTSAGPYADAREMPVAGSRMLEPARSNDDAE